MQITIAIVDDTSEDACRIDSDIIQYFRTHVPEHTVRTLRFESGEAFLAIPACTQVHMVFFDICMQGISGIEAARALRRRDARCLIVFLTVSREYSWQAFPVHPFDYLIKPCSTEQLERVLTEALRVLVCKEPKLTLRLAHQNMQLTYSQISHVIAQNHSISVTLTNGTCLIAKNNFTELSELLSSDPRFLVCNRGVLVNMDEALKLEDGCIFLNDGSRFPVRQREKSRLATAFAQYQLQRIREER